MAIEESVEKPAEHPAEESADAPVEDSRANAGRVAGRASSVFVVDDDGDSRELVAALLRIEGFEVTEFEAAEDVLAALPGELPSLVVTDVTLAGMSGADAARALRADPRTRAIPVLAVTGHHVHDLREDRLLFDAILVKPIDVTKLLGAVRRLVG